MLFVFTLLVVVFAIGAFLGAPFLPSLKETTEEALDLLDLKPGQTLLDAGAGTGIVLLAAAQRGIKGIGYEINPILWAFAKLRTYKHRSLVELKLADFWHSDWPKVDGVYTFLISRYMAKFDEKLQLEFTHPVKVVSYIYKIPDRQPEVAKNGLYLYHYS